MRKQRKAIFIAGVGLICAVLGVALFWLNQVLKVKQDLDRLQTESYDTVFFSMYSTEGYTEHDWMHFRAMKLVKTEYEISNYKLLQKYMDAMSTSENTVTRVYLGVDPMKVSKEEVVLMLQQHPAMHFEVVLPYPQISYWTKPGEAEWRQRIDAYQLFAEWVLPLENADIYFFGGEEWLIGNEANYFDTFGTNTQVSTFLMCNFDIQHSYRLTAENLQVRFDNMRAVVNRYRENPVEYPKAVQTDIVFIGDSIIGNYTNSLSVPEVVRGLTKARVFNCGYGGKGAAKNELTLISFPEIVEALVKEDLEGFPQEAQLTMGLQAFLERENAGKQLMFVINFGLNDYFSGVPIVGTDAYDNTSYEGALRAGVEKLKTAYPKAQIVLMTPNFTVYYECGEQQMSEQGGILSDYAEAVRRLAKEQQVDLLDNFAQLPITAENWQLYQEDGCHLNERGRFLLGSRIAQSIRIED